MTITAIILSHYKEREVNLKKILDDLYSGSTIPDKTIVFIDNPLIEFEDNRVTIIRSNVSFLPNIRFGIGSICRSDYCFFLDDDLSVKEKTLENFEYFAEKFPNAILGLEGSVLGNTNTPYTDDTPIRNPSSLTYADVIIRTYFCPTKSLMAGLKLRALYPHLPERSLDDVFLSLGNIYLNHESNFVIPASENSRLIELGDKGVGQSYSGDHYKNRNEVCRFLREVYAGKNDWFGD